MNSCSRKGFNDVIGSKHMESEIKRPIICNITKTISTEYILYENIMIKSHVQTTDVQVYKYTKGPVKIML